MSEYVFLDDVLIPDPDYRSDEEMYVYDQSCENCHNTHCPMLYSSLDDPTLTGKQAVKEIRKRRKEDGIMREGKLIWCIHWKQR